MDKIQERFSTMKRLAQCFYFQPMTVINKMRVFTVSLIPLNPISLKQTDNASDCSLIFYYTDPVTFLNTKLLLYSFRCCDIISCPTFFSFFSLSLPIHEPNSFLRKTCKSTAIDWLI